MLPSDRVAGFGEGDIQQATECFQSMRGSHLAQLVEPADDKAKCFHAVLCLPLARRFLLAARTMKCAKELAWVGGRGDGGAS
ncbi:hypothetical protein LCM4577_29980 [Mesorhizobium sp. LCM 4577]|nr:hypothetical protein LCM4577_29980 [Mesorhizobium sp. LCM 4577]